MTDDFASKLDAASGPLKRLSAITAQVGLSTIPADAQCCHLCPIYEPHLCDGWRDGDCVRDLPSAPLFGMQLPPVQVPMCRSCFGVERRKA